MNRNVRVRSLVLLTACSVSMLAQDGQPQEPNQEQQESYIIQYRETPTKAHVERVQRRGGRVEGTFRNVRAAKAMLSRAAKLELEQDPDIDFIAPDQPLSANLDEATFVAGVNDVRWTRLWKGNGIGIAILDSGVKPVADLQDWNSTTSRLVYNKSFVAGEDANDYFGHGTHVAGIAAASGYPTNNTLKGVVGAAEEADIINIKVLNKEGKGSDSTVIAGIDHAISIKNTYNIKVLNLSLGRPVSTTYQKDPLCQAVERAWKAGIVVIVSAGNNGRNTSNNTNGYGTINSPGNDPFVITVGAANTQHDWNITNDLIATYSSKGPTMVDQVIKPDLVAPGNQILSLEAAGGYLAVTYPQNKADEKEFYQGKTGKSEKYFRLSGTSMAAPIVSGIAASILGARNLTPDQIKAVLMKTARKTFGARYDAFTVGAGMVDATAAANLITTSTLPVGPALSPRAYWDAATNSAKVTLEYTATLKLASSGMCMDVPGSTDVEATQLIQWPCHGDPNQQWKQRKVGNGYQIISQSSGMCLNVNQALRTVGAQMIQWPCGGAGETNALFTPVAAGAGYQLKALHSGMCVSVDAANKMVQVNCAATSNQIWARADGLPLGQNIVWGDNFNTLSNSTYGTNIVWGDTAIFGTNIVWGDSLIMKGTNVVWGDTSIYSSGSVLNQATFMDVLIAGDK